MNKRKLYIDVLVLCLVFILFLCGILEFYNYKNIPDESIGLSDMPIMFPLQGSEYSMLTEEFDFNNRKDIDYLSFCEELAAFGNVKRVEVCNTNLTYEQLDNLMLIYPDTKFVFTITLANTWTIKTDVVAFSTNKAHHNPAIKDNEVWKLKYLTDAVALDIGHNEITDLSFLQFLPNIKILILADNWITDLSPVKYCKNLMYIETFCNPIRDISALSELDNLVDINVSYNYFTDYTPLLNKPKLERLHITHTSLSSNSINELKAAYPDVRIEHTCDTSVQGGWRTHPRYYAMREMFMTNTVHELFMDSSKNEISDNENRETEIVNTP